MNERPPAPPPGDDPGRPDTGVASPPARRTRRLRGYPARGKDISQISAQPLPPAGAGPAAAADPEPGAAPDETA